MKRLVVLLFILLLLFTSCTVPDTTDYIEDEVNNVYSKIISCSISDDVMTVAFSAYAESPKKIDVFMDVWMSDDNGAGSTNEVYSISKLKEYTISMSSFWFEQNESHKDQYYEVTLQIGMTTHKFGFRSGKIEYWFS